MISERRRFQTGDHKQPIAFIIILVIALMADGLMETLWPLGFCLVTGPLLAVAWVLIELSYRPKKKRRPRGRNPRRRHDQPKG